MMKVGPLWQKLSIPLNCFIFCLWIYLIYDNLTILLSYPDASSNTRASGIYYDDFCGYGIKGTIMKKKKTNKTRQDKGECLTWDKIKEENDGRY